ncbi:MAG: hypothetical protein RIR18_935 [Pseudomonadota bacterium]
MGNPDVAVLLQGQPGQLGWQWMIWLTMYCWIPANPRVFGSVMRGTDTENSDLDLLVDPLPGVTLFDLGAIQIELEESLGVSVDVLTPKDLPESFRAQVLAEAAQLIENCPDFVNAHKEVPWPQMKGMRNRMAHGYFELDMEIVWETCQALPLLVSQLERVIAA